MDYNILKYDLENRFGAYTISDTEDGDGYIAKAKGTWSNNKIFHSGRRMSLWDAYKDLTDKLLDGIEPTPCLKQNQINSLDNTKTPTGYLIWNLSNSVLDCYNGTDYSSASGELGALTHLPKTTATATDSDPVILMSIELEEDMAYLFTAEVIAENSDHTRILGVILECTARRLEDGGAEIVGNVTTTHSGGDAQTSSWKIDMEASGNDLNLIAEVVDGIELEADMNYLKY